MSDLTNLRNFSSIVETARTHYVNLKTDIANSQNRVEHIRLSALAQEAHNVYTSLVAFEVGLVYSHTSRTDDYINRAVQESTATIDLDTGEILDGLDLPEFRSPYDPRNQ
jgi:5-carboxymethyl-2-hydroxymuconate isomerase